MEIDELQTLAEEVDQLGESVETATSVNAIMTLVFRAAMGDNSYNYRKNPEVAKEFYAILVNKDIVKKQFYLEFIDAFGGASYIETYGRDRRVLGLIPRLAKFLRSMKVSPRVTDSSISTPLDDGYGSATRAIELNMNSFMDLDVRALGNRYSRDAVSKAYTDFFKALDILGSWEAEQQVAHEAEVAEAQAMNAQDVVKRVRATVRYVFRDMAIGEETISPAYAIGWLAGILQNVKPSGGYIEGLIPNRLETGKNYLEIFDYIFRDVEDNVVLNDKRIKRGSSEYNPGGSAKDQGFVFTLHIPSQYVSGAPEYLTRTIGSLAKPISVNKDAQVQAGVLQSDGNIRNVDFVGTLIKRFGFRFGDSPTCAPGINELLQVRGINADMVKHGYDVGKTMALKDVKTEDIDPFALQFPEADTTPKISNLGANADDGDFDDIE